MVSRTHIARWLILGLLAANALIWYALLVEERGGTLTVVFLDVGQGDSIYIEAPSGRQVLIDGGSGPAALRALSAVVPFYDRTLDAVIGTHPDKDHIGGLSGVLARYKVDLFLDPGVPNDTSAWRALEEAARERGVSRKTARRGMTIDMGGGVTLAVLFPDRDLGKISDTNDASVVAKLSYGEIDVLLTGDAPKKIEEYLVRLDGKDLASEVLKAGHHGSKTSSAPVFLKAVDPAYAVISAGKGNSYGHPHKEALENLGAVGARVLQTVDRGTIVFRSDGKELTLLPASRWCRIAPPVCKGNSR